VIKTEPISLQNVLQFHVILYVSVYKTFGWTF